MTKNDIAVELCKRIPVLPKSTDLHVVEGVIDILSDAFVRGDNIYLRGFGTLALKNIKARTARNIRTGETVSVPAQNTVKFRISKELKARLNNG